MDNYCEERMYHFELLITKFKIENHEHEVTNYLIKVITGSVSDYLPIGDADIVTQGFDSYFLHCMLTYLHICSSNFKLKLPC